jgi:hypothetical protein
MGTETTLSAFRKSLRAAHLRHAVLPLVNAHSLLVTEHWGKAFGPFKGDKDCGTLWVSPKAADPGGLRDMVNSGDWCVGGDRLWLAPEVQFNIPDRKHWDSDGAYVLPGAIDPGRYTLTAGNKNCVALSQELEAKQYNTASGLKKVSIERRFFPANDPLEPVAEYRHVRNRVEFTGYSEEARLEDLSGDGAAFEMWNLLQVRPPGVAVLPSTSALEYQDYYEPVDRRHLAIQGNAAVLRLTGDRKFKVGWKSAGLWGRIGYYREMPGSQLRLVVRQFFNNPSSRYVDEPAGRKGAAGDSVQFYNDDGSLGGFAEIEVHGQSLGGRPSRGSPERGSVVDYLVFWQYTGKPENVKKIGELLLGTGVSTWG